ncbi:hypothetical protein B0H10DRAFT_1956027 [Mycena sp. CBHHK59/15]|nr:hypothetical protein B0H10DRAFT_1956027 [Mycena sp. CBHHK59/15]
MVLRLELVGMPLPLAATLECGELVVHGTPLPMDALGPALHELVAAQGRARHAQSHCNEGENFLMGSESEWEEAPAFKVGGVFNDPVFDARYAYAVAGVAAVGV